MMGRDTLRMIIMSAYCMRYPGAPGLWIPSPNHFSPTPSAAPISTSEPGECVLCRGKHLGRTHHNGEVISTAERVALPVEVERVRRNLQRSREPATQVSQSVSGSSDSSHRSNGGQGKGVEGTDVA